MELSSDILNELAKELDKYPNVVGFSNSLQKRIRKGKVVNENCIRIYVTHKIPERSRTPGVKVLKPHEIIPRKLCGFPVDIVETEGIPEILPYRKAILIKQKQQKIRPLVAGISIGNIDISAGTLGIFMKHIDCDDQVYPASNAHVFLPFPGTRKISVHCKAIYMYCAGYEPTQHKISIPSLNEEVIKTGRSSCVTKAKVIDENATIKVNYGHFLAQFTDVFLSSIMLYPGDSGSAIFTEIKS